MSALFNRVVFRVTWVHVGCLLLLMAWQWSMSRPLKIKRPDIITFIDLAGGPPAAAAGAAEAITKPVQTFIEPPKSTVIAEPTPKQKIQVSTKKIKRSDIMKAPQKKLSAEEIKRMLASGIPPSTKIGGGGGGGPGSDSPVAWYYAVVRQMMYDAWVLPSGLTLSPGLSAEVTIRVSREGNIMERQMTRSSGNSQMDESVMTAVNSVSKLKPLPPQFIGPSRDIVILFEPTKEAY